MTGDNQLRGDERSPEFARALELLEEWGAAILVAGEVDDRAMQAVTRRMMGAPSEDRYRVLTLLNDNDPESYLPEEVTPAQDGVRTIQHPLGRAVTDSGFQGEGVGATSVGPGVLGEIHRELVSACQAFAERPQHEPHPAGRLEPGELRVVVDTLQPLIVETGIETVVDWLHADVVPALRNSRFRGRSHWTYYGLSDGPTVDSLMANPNLFDVLVRVRRRGSHVEFKWVLPADRFPHLSTRKVTSWMSIDT